MILKEKYFTINYLFQVLVPFKKILDLNSNNFIYITMIIITQNNITLKKKSSQELFFSSVDATHTSCHYLIKWFTFLKQRQLISTTAIVTTHNNDYFKEKESSREHKFTEIYSCLDD